MNFNEVNENVKPTIVFCHGLWADGSCFNKVIEPLIAEGYNAVAVQYGLNTYQEDLDMIQNTLNRINGPVILVGHSYGGATITGAGNDQKVKALVYIAALAPDAGETAQDQVGDYPTEVFKHLDVTDGKIWLLPEGTKYFAGDLSELEQKVIWATHYPPSEELLVQQNLSADQVAWKTKPSWYILCTDDNAVHPELQRVLANRMNASITEIKSSHVPMLSHPETVIEVIKDAYNSIA